MLKLCQGDYAVLVSNCHRNFLNMILKLDSSFHSLHRIVHQLESDFKIDHSVSKLLSVKVFDNISKLHSNITIKWPASN